MGLRPPKDVWCPTSNDVFKFNGDGAAQGKPGPAVVGGERRGYEFIFLNMSRGKDSNKAEVLAILNDLGVFTLDFHGPLIVEINSASIHMPVIKVGLNYLANKPLTWLYGVSTISKFWQ